MDTEQTRRKLSQRITPRTEDVRGPFFRDQTAIIHSGSFRRLKSKTQVFFSPENDHVCTRIEHVLHVATIAATICKGVRSRIECDDELAYAAGLGHDLGHTPFGHSGERALSDFIGQFGGEPFYHEVQSLRVVDKLARHGQGLNLTYGVRDSIICHNGESFEQVLIPDTDMPDPAMKVSPDRRPSTTEGCIVRFSDKIAYLGRDLEDALRMRLITKEEIPSNILLQLGNTNGEIINSLVIDLIETSLSEGVIGFSDKYFRLVDELQKFNYRKIYSHPVLMNYEKYCKTIIRQLYAHYYELYGCLCSDESAYAALELPGDRSFGQYVKNMEGLYTRENTPTWQVIADYVSGMSDKFTLQCYEELVLPHPILTFQA